ncbi:MAG: aminofutalosine synthase MqnE [Anaeromyxobacteraceae bacterium]
MSTAATGAPGLASIRDKVRTGEPLAFEDGVALYRHPNLMEVGALANEVRERLHGQRTYFNRNFHINATNVCVASCMFCSFARLKEGDAGAYTMKLEEAWGKLQERVDAGEPVTEIHIVNGLHDGLPFEYYTELLAGLKRIKPSIHLKAFTAVEIFYYHQHYGMSIEEVLRRLHEAGLDSLPGGGAEIFAPRVRRKICDDKATAEQWLEVHRVAHRLGMKTNATMLYGTIERLDERVDHMARLRALQDETKGFQVFIPLAFHPEHNMMGRAFPKPTGYDGLRTYAVARLFLDNFDHVKAYWIMLGERLAQSALSFGVDDLDGTVLEERIYHMAGAQTPQALAESQLHRLIRTAGRVPAERDSLYHVLRVHDSTVHPERTGDSSVHPERRASAARP